jgi:hypothetical protein
MLWLVVLAGFAASFSPRVPDRPDYGAFAVFGVLVGGFSWLAQASR